jgi:AraC-like DNA-binding protein
LKILIKKYLSILLLFLFPGTEISAQHEQRGIFHIKPATVPISINGILSEWKDADSIFLYYNQDKSRYAVVKALWDYEKLYVSYKVSDHYLNSHIHENGLEIWTDDCVEMYICTDSTIAMDSVMTTKDYQFMANIKNNTAIAGGYADKPNDYKGMDSWMEKCKKHIYWISGFVSATRIQGSLNNNNDTDSGYAIEFAINWSWINYSPESNDKLLADFCIEDPGKNFSFDYYDWCKLTRNFAQPAKWGTIVLSGTPPNKPSFLSKNKLFIILTLTALIILSFLLRLFLFLRKKQKSLQAFQISGEIPVSYSNQLVNKAMALIEVEYFNEISTNDIAGKIFISERHFQRLLKQETGKTFRELLNEIRCKKAKELLMNTNLTVFEISLKVGFNNYTYFVRVFKSLYNIQPLAFRKDFIRSVQN